MPAGCVDLVFTSPPYELARTYGANLDKQTAEWVPWCADRFEECLRVCRGLVAWVVGHGQGGCRRWSAGPALLMAEIHRRGIALRNPAIYHRIGIPGSGSNDWLRADYEWIICATAQGKRLPWSDNTAMGEPPKYGCFGGHTPSGYTEGDVRHLKKAGGPYSYRTKEGERVYNKQNKPYAKANPGNVIKCIVGGGKMGHPLAHENEAPFPLSLAEFFVRSFCPPDGVVLDPFCGSGTTLHAALLHKRRSIGIDIRSSQIDITTRRLASL